MGAHFLERDLDVPTLHEPSYDLRGLARRFGTEQGLRREAWERGYQHAPDPDDIVWIDIDTFDRLWWLSDQYIAAPGDTSDNQPQKYAKAGRCFLAGEPMWMPKVGRDADGSLNFRDGRHRYLWMRENGGAAMPVAVEKSDAKVVRALCGTRRRTSLFIPPRSKVPTAAILAGLGLAVAGLVAVARL